MSYRLRQLENGQQTDRVAYMNDFYIITNVDIWLLNIALIHGKAALTSLSMNNIFLFLYQFFRGRIHGNVRVGNRICRQEAPACRWHVTVLLVGSGSCYVGRISVCGA